MLRSSVPIPLSKRGVIHTKTEPLCACSRHAMTAHLQSYRSIFLTQSSRITALLFVPVVLLGVVANVETKTLGVEVDLVVTLLEDAGNGSGVVEFTQVNVRPALLDGITDQLCGASLTLSSDDHGLLFLPGLVHDEGGTLGVLLSNLLGFDGRGELGREGKVLCIVSCTLIVS
jgi:hypothetical protein